MKEERKIAFMMTVGLMALAFYVYQIIQSIEKIPNAQRPQISNKKTAVAFQRIKPSVVLQVEGKKGSFKKQKLPQEALIDTQQETHWIRAKVRFPHARVLQTEDSGVDGQGVFSRVTLVEADFKYPMVRIEQKLKRDDQAGRELVLKEVTMIADHVVVHLQAGKTESDLLGAVEKYNGYIKRKLSVPGYYIVGFDGSQIHALEQKVAQFSSEKEIITTSEPDFVVSPENS